MKKNIYISFITLLGWASNAQSNDSLWIPSTMDTHGMKALQWSSPIHASRVNFSNYTFSGVKTEFADRKIKRIQSPDQIHNYQFVTEGIYQINPKVRVFGDFSFSKEVEKGMAYNLSSYRTTDEKILEPNYYFSPSKGDWNNQLYQFTGGGSYEFLKNAFLGAVFNYKNSLFTRNSDPRPENTGNTIDYKIQLGYQLKNHLLSAEFLHYKFKEENSIYYENKTLNAATNPQFYIRLSSGYGYNLYNANYYLFLNNTNLQGFGLNYSFKNTNHFFTVGYTYKEGETNYYGPNTNAGANTRPLEDQQFIKYSSFKSQNQLQAFYRTLHTQSPFEISLSYASNDWKNYIVETKSTNSIQIGSDIKLHANKFFNNQWIHNLGAKVNVNKIDVKDYLGIAEKINKTLDFTIFAQKNFDFKNHTFYTHLGLGIITPISNELFYQPVAQDQDFANEVILKDNLYDDTTFVKGELILGYDLPIKNDNTVRFKANYQFLNGKSNQLLNGFLMQGTTNYLGLGVSILY